MGHQKFGKLLMKDKKSTHTNVDACPNPPPSVLQFCESYVKKIKMSQSASMIRPFRIHEMNEVNDDT